MGLSGTPSGIPISCPSPAPAASWQLYTPAPAAGLQWVSPSIVQSASRAWLNAAPASSPDSSYSTLSSHSHRLGSEFSFSALSVQVDASSGSLSNSCNVSTATSGSAGTSPRSQAYSSVPATASQMGQQQLLQAQPQAMQPPGQYALLQPIAQQQQLPAPLYSPQQQPLSMQYLQHDALPTTHAGRYAPRQPPPPGRLFVGQLDGAVNEAVMDAVFSTCGRVVGTKVSWPCCLPAMCCLPCPATLCLGCVNCAQGSQCTQQLLRLRMLPGGGCCTPGWLARLAGWLAGWLAHKGHWPCACGQVAC
jgi:hypothetical protein